MKTLNKELISNLKELLKGNKIITTDYKNKTVTLSTYNPDKKIEFEGPLKVKKVAKNKLPKYWIVENDGSQEFQDTVVKYLNETYKQNWRGDGVGYYGYDGNRNNNGSVGYENIEHFLNNPTLLALKQFKEMTTPKAKKIKFKLGEQVAVSDTSEEEAIQDLASDLNDFYYTGGKNRTGSDIVEVSNGNYSVYKYIAKIPKPKTIKIKDVKGNECEIEESKLKTLGFTKI